MQSVQRALQLLMWVCANPTKGDGMRLAELTRLAGLTKPSVYRLMNTLEEFRLVSRGAGTNGYLPGPGLFQLAHEGLERINIR